MDPTRTKEAGHGSDTRRIPPQVEEVAGHLPGRRCGRLPDRVPGVLQPRGRRWRPRLLNTRPRSGARGRGRELPPLFAWATQAALAPRPVLEDSPTGPGRVPE